MELEISSLLAGEHVSKFAVEVLTLFTNLYNVSFPRDQRESRKSASPT